MWFPPIQPSAVAGRSIWLRAYFLGSGAIVENGQVITGPLFRDGAELFMLRSKNEGDMSALEFHPVRPDEVFGLTAPGLPEAPIAPDAAQARLDLQAAPEPEAPPKPSALDRVKNVIGWPGPVPVDSDTL